MVFKKNKRETAFISSDLKDACKTLFANICFSRVDEGIQVICITSAYASEGKSTTAINLAVAIAQSGKKTLLVENDMRKRTLSSALHLSGKYDLCDLIRGNVKIPDAVIPTDYDNLYFLDVAPGISSPPDVLSSERYAKLIERLKERFDYIILDVPPVLLFADALIAASIADGTVLVVKEGSTKRTAALKALNQLKTANAQVLGISMSCCKVDKDDYYYYAYYSSSGERKSTSKSKASAKLSMSDLERNDRPVWDVDYDETKEKLPVKRQNAIPKNVSAQSRHQNRRNKGNGPTESQ